jgi:hypothetical protein
MQVEDVKLRAAANGASDAVLARVELLAYYSPNTGEIERERYWQQQFGAWGGDARAARPRVQAARVRAALNEAAARLLARLLEEASNAFLHGQLRCAHLDAGVVLATRERYARWELLETKHGALEASLQPAANAFNLLSRHGALRAKAVRKVAILLKWLAVDDLFIKAGRVHPPAGHTHRLTFARMEVCRSLTTWWYTLPPTTQ